MYVYAGKPRWRFISSPVKIGELCPLAHLQSISQLLLSRGPSILDHLRHATAPGLPFRILAEDPPCTRNEEEEEEEEEKEKKSVAKPVSTKVTRRAMRRWETEKERRDGRAHQLMEAAINNAAVVYHSDPRLILPVVPGCQPASQPAGGLFHPLLPPEARSTSTILDPTTPRSPTVKPPRRAPPPTRFGNALAGLRSGRKL